MTNNRYSNETPREKFERLATKRTQTVIDKIRILGNCSNTYIYEFSEKDVKKIFSTIENELKAIKAKFLHKDKVNKFSL